METIKRDKLAEKRTKLANERTLMAYTRTFLYLIIAGLALINIEGFHWLGYISLCSSILLLSIGVIRYVKMNNSIKNLQ
jgi:putative membrane protein